MPKLESTLRVVVLTEDELRETVAEVLVTPQPVALAIHLDGSEIAKTVVVAPRDLAPKKG